MIVRGIKRKAIFKGDVDKVDFLERLEHNLLASSMKTGSNLEFCQGEFQ